MKEPQSIAPTGNPSEIATKRPRDWRLIISNALSNFSIAWIGVEFLILAVLYNYAWQKGLYPNPDAPESVSHGPWAFDVFLNEGARELFNPPINSFFCAVLALLIKPTVRASICLTLSFIFLAVAVQHIGMCDD